MGACVRAFQKSSRLIHDFVSFRSEKLKRAVVSLYEAGSAVWIGHEDCMARCYLLPQVVSLFPPVWSSALGSLWFFLLQQLHSYCCNSCIRSHRPGPRVGPRALSPSQFLAEFGIDYASFKCTSYTGGNQHDSHTGGDLWISLGTLHPRAQLLSPLLNQLTRCFSLEPQSVIASQLRVA